MFRIAQKTASCARATRARRHSVRQLSVLAAVAALTFGCSGVSPPQRSVHFLESPSAQGTPFKITYIPIPGPTVRSGVSFAQGAVWSVSGQFSRTSTIRVDAETHRVAVIERPFDTFDLMVGNRSIWLSKPVYPLAGGGDLHRYDIDTGRLVATVPAAGTPFALSSDRLWAYHGAGAVTGIDLHTNQLRVKVDAPPKSPTRHFTYGDGSLWQFSHQEKLSAWEIARQAAAPAVVRRVDPHSKQILAEIPIGPARVTAGIYYVAGDIWVLGDRHDLEGGFATRIDTGSNRIIATIDLNAPPYPPIAANALPQTPVYWNGGVWISTFYSDRGRLPGLLRKIDLGSNRVVDSIGLADDLTPGTGQPMLVVGGDALWAVGREAVLRIEAVR